MTTKHNAARRLGPAAATAGSATATMESTHVVKTIRPCEPGALKLARVYGDALVCVRYRHDETGERRYTTVEVVVDSVPVQRRERTRMLVDVKIDHLDRPLRSLVMAGGGHWDIEAQAWKLPRAIARRLGLLPESSGT